jgi:hypothetical protein
MSLEVALTRFSVFAIVVVHENTLEKGVEWSGIVNWIAFPGIPYHMLLGLLSC